MRAILKEFYSLDIDMPLVEFYPEKHNNFGFWARMIIGEKEIGGEESFDILICTPKWLLNNHAKNEIIFGKHHLIVFEYNYHNIYKKLKYTVENTEGNDWNEIGLKLGAIANWEFEDYRE